jgi:RNA polymerase sigma-70 factor, ECF subfamily
MEMAGSEINRIHEVADNLDQGQAQELTNIMLRRLPYFHGIALRRLGNVADAEDAVQDAFLSAYTHLEQFKGQARMSTWLTTIVINSARMKARGRSRQLHIPLDAQHEVKDSRPLIEGLSDTRPSPEEVCRRKEFRERLAQLSTRLSPSMRRTFQLHAVEGLSIREIARLLGVTDGAVKARVSRARARLRRLASGGNTRKHAMA